MLGCEELPDASTLEALRITDSRRRLHLARRVPEGLLVGAAPLTRHAGPPVLVTPTDTGNSIKSKLCRALNSVGFRMMVMVRAAHDVPAPPANLATVCAPDTYNQPACLEACKPATACTVSFEACMASSSTAGSTDSKRFWISSRNWFSTTATRSCSRSTGVSLRRISGAASSALFSARSVTSS